MKKRIVAAENSNRTFRIYFSDGNQKLAGGPGASIKDAIEYIAVTDNYTVDDIYKVEEVTDINASEYIDDDDDEYSDGYGANPYDWYYTLPATEQFKVDQIAEEWGLPYTADEWTLEEMYSLMHAYDNLM